MINFSPSILMLENVYKNIDMISKQVNLRIAIEHFIFVLILVAHSTLCVVQT